MKTILLILICLGLNESLSSQNNYVTISGIVTSKNNNEKIANAYIFLRLNSGLISEAKTDTLGHYMFEILNDSVSDF